jgi:hypothetical protein
VAGPGARGAGGRGVGAGRARRAAPGGPPGRARGRRGASRAGSQAKSGQGKGEHVEIKRYRMAQLGRRRPITAHRVPHTLAHNSSGQARRDPTLKVAPLREQLRGEYDRTRTNEQHRHPSACALGEARQLATHAPTFDSPLDEPPLRCSTRAQTPTTAAHRNSRNLTLLLGHADRAALAAGGLCALTADAKAPCEQKKGSSGESRVVRRGVRQHSKCRTAASQTARRLSRGKAGRGAHSSAASRGGRGSSSGAPSPHAASCRACSTRPG